MRLAARGQLLDDFHRAVGGGAFLVGRDEERDGAAARPDVRRRSASIAVTNAASEPSCRPRRGRRESRRARVGVNGSASQRSSGPVGTTSV